MIYLYRAHGGEYSRTASVITNPKLRLWSCNSLFLHQIDWRQVNSEFHGYLFDFCVVITMFSLYHAHVSLFIAANDVPTSNIAWGECCFGDDAAF